MSLDSAFDTTLQDSVSFRNKTIARTQSFCDKDRVYNRFVTDGLVRAPLVLSVLRDTSRQDHDNILRRGSSVALHTLFLAFCERKVLLRVKAIEFEQNLGKFSARYCFTV